MKKVARWGRDLGHVPKFRILGTPNISGTSEDKNLKFCMQIDRNGY